jgi:uroporphyrinogen decarboxylase
MKKEELTSRERIRLALNHQETDRIPVDLGGSDCTTITLKAYENLKKYLGFKEDTKIFSRRFQTVRIAEELQRLLHCEVRLIPYRPSARDRALSNAGDTYTDEWGLDYQSDGLYFNITNAPLKDATIGDLESYAWPDPSDPERVKGVAEEARYWHEHSTYALLGPGIACSLFEQCWYLRGFEQFLLDLMMDKEFAHALLRKVLDIRKVMYGNFLEQAGKYLDVIYVADDIAMQSGPMMSLDLFKEMIKPYYKEYFGFLKGRTEAKLFYHCCGGVEPFLEDLIDIGCDILNPLQTTAAGMDPVQLKEKYGDRIVFWGGVDTQRILPKGTPNEVQEETAKMIDIMGEGGGYVLAAVHNIQPDTPPENIMAMLDTAFQYRR